MENKCNKCGFPFEPDMTVNVCLDGCGSFCDECCSPDIDYIINVGEICPVCKGKTRTVEEIDEPDNIDYQIKDAK
jgi:hypothetical protein